MSWSCPGRVQVVSRSCLGRVRESCLGVVSRCRVQVVSRCRVQVVSRCRVQVLSDHFLCAVSTSIQMDHILPVPCGLPLLRGAPFSCVLIWTCVTGLPRSRNILLPAVLSTWCSENEGWTSYIRSDHPRRACSSAERSPPTTAAILVELRLSACIARNGALRDHRRTPSAESHARFRSARHAFHRTIRSAQRAF